MQDPETQSTSSDEDATKINEGSLAADSRSKRNGGKRSDYSGQSVPSVEERAAKKEGAGDAADGNDEKMGDQANSENDVMMKDDGAASGEQKGSDGEENEGSATGSSATAVYSETKEEEKKSTEGDSMDVDMDKKNSLDDNGAGSGGSTTASAPSGAAGSSPPPPVLRGTLSYSAELRRHLIRGMWNYENSNALPPQRFELLRNLEPDEDASILPTDGEFHGSFSLAYFHTTSKGKQKERSKVIPESGVNIKFTKVEGEKGHFKCDGKGTNQFGIFHINGTASPSSHDDGQYNIVLRKRYEPSAQSSGPSADTDAGKKTKKRKMGTVSAGIDLAEVDEGPLPPPTKSHDKNVVCLRGKVYKEESDELGTMDVVHRIHGMWATGLDLVLADPENFQGLCNQFEYEHKTSSTSANFPVSGRYSGWFDLNLEDGSKKKISEKDVTLRFKRNSEGFHNVEGRGSNAFGKYSITGTLTAENVLTIFRHFQVKKSKAARPVTSAPPPINAPGQTRRPSLPVISEPQLKLDEVKVPTGDAPMDALKPPDKATYSAVSRGVLRLNDDGSLSCQGKWAVSRDHFTNGQTSNFTFRLEAHFAAEALKKSDGRGFPLDSEMYKGSFQLKKGGSRYQTVIDQQIVMKFRKNTTGSYNVYGKGVNAIGVFNLTGTLIMSGKTGGQVEVYRIYPPALLAPPAPAKAPASQLLASKSLVGPSADEATSSAPTFPGPPRPGLSRRESTRLVKVPSRLEDDDPEAKLQRSMEKCTGVLRFIREKDVERGAFFSEPVDPVALGIPTYHQFIHEPMDLRTLAHKMDAKEVTTPEEFARLARLVFENAMTFNVDPTHSVHQAARNLLILFNQKYRDIERMVTNLRRNTGDKKKGKDENKRRRQDDTRSLKQRRLDEAQEMTSGNASSIAAIAGAVPRDPHASVSRNEFSLMVQMMTELQQQVVQTFTALAELSSDEPGSGAIQPVHDIISSPVDIDYFSSPAVPEKKTKKKAEPKQEETLMDFEEDATPLSLPEQELLTETINKLEHEHLHGVIQIIREAAKISGEEEEIDLEIDQLDAVTQRKLLSHVSKFIKQPKKTKVKAPKKRAVPKKSEPPPKKVKAAPPAKKKDPDSFFAFGGQEDSDSDSEGEITAPTPTPAPTALGVPAPAAVTGKDFSLGEGFGGGEDEEDDDSDNEEEMTNGAPAASWTISQPTTAENNEIDEDDGWAGAREAAAIAKVREEDKKKREEKMKAEAEQLKNQRLADAVAHGEEIKAQRQAEEEEEARLKEEQEKEVEEQRQKAREAALEQAQSVEQTVDLDIQRDIMKQYEQNFMDKEMGSASPSSDFGF